MIARRNPTIQEHVKYKASTAHHGLNSSGITTAQVRWATLPAAIWATILDRTG